jgi:hypothetical protein
VYWRYVGVLGAGAKRAGSPERLAYERLRESLSGDNLPARIYKRWLRVALDPRFLGLKGGVPSCPRFTPKPR